MKTDLDTLLTALYVLVDDHVIPSGQRRPGHPRQLSDAQLVCLAAAQVLVGAQRASLAAGVPRAAGPGPPPKGPEGLRGAPRHSGRRWPRHPAQGS